jgi:hypothetical protein
LSYLRPLSSSWTSNVSSSHTELTMRVKNLPKEIRDQIVAAIPDMDNPPLQCTRLIGPSYWQQLLLGGAALPHLWDINSKVFHKIMSEKAGHWDFELLVRQLGQTGIWEYFQRNRADKALYGLRNRRRIWRLVEEMEVGDVKPWKKIVIKHPECDNSTCPVHHQFWPAIPYDPARPERSCTSPTGGDKTWGPYIAYHHETCMPGCSLISNHRNGTSSS